MRTVSCAFHFFFFPCIHIFSWCLVYATSGKLRIQKNIFNFNKKAYQLLNVRIVYQSSFLSFNYLTIFIYRVTNLWSKVINILIRQLLEIWHWLMWSQGLLLTQQTCTPGLLQCLVKHVCIKYSGRWCKIIFPSHCNCLVMITNGDHSK